MKFASWNVNSINARLERVVGFLQRVEPDVVCLQELKCEEQKFPHEAIAALGYHSAIFGQKTYNGVAILARTALNDIHRGFDDGIDDDEARIIAATVAGVRIISAYIPNGKEVGSDRYAYKLAWLKRLRHYLDTNLAIDQPIILAGDFNVAHDDRDCHAPEEWQGHLLVSDPERRALQKVLDFGLYDTLRLHKPEPGIYSWWDYRALGFPMNKGMRIDYAFVTKPAADKCVDAWVERQERKGKKPSDHAPVMAQFDF